MAGESGRVLHYEPLVCRIKTLENNFDEYQIALVAWELLVLEYTIKHYRRHQYGFIFDCCIFEHTCIPQAFSKPVDAEGKENEEKAY